MQLKFINIKALTKRNPGLLRGAETNVSALGVLLSAVLGTEDLMGDFHAIVPQVLAGNLLGHLVSCHDKTANRSNSLRNIPQVLSVHSAPP